VAGRFEPAAVAFDRVTVEETNHGAAHLGLAYCRQQLGRLDQALERYDVARTLLPNDHRPHYFRGGIYGIQNRQEQAEIEFTRAVEINPAHTKSLINRAIYRSMAGKNREAEQDLTQVIDRKVSLVRAHLQRATIREALQDTNGAAADRQAAETATPDGEEDYVARGLARAQLEPRAALEDFPALVNQLNILTDQLQDTDRALTVASRCVTQFPGYAPVRAQRALLLAQLNRREEAHREAEEAHKLACDARVTHQLARVYALTSESHPEDKDRAITLLQQALREGFADLKRLTTDPHLAPLRTHPGFKKILKAVETLYL
jgi:tetratricopeptide (TPR) repeat protein